MSRSCDNTFLAMRKVLDHEMNRGHADLANARPLDYLKFLPTAGGKIRPPMPDDGTVYEWDADFGWIEAADLT